MTTSVLVRPLPRPKRAVLSMLLSVAAVACAALACYGVHHHHRYVQHNAARVLQAVATTTALHVQIQTIDTSSSSPSFVASGWLFPRNHNSDRADVLALAVDARLIYEHDGLVYNATILDGRGFVTIENATTQAVVSSGCLASSDAPPLHLIPQALQAARVVDAAPAHGVTQADCAAETRLVEVTFAGASFVYCARHDGRLDRDATVIHGETMKMTLTPVTHDASPRRETVLARPSGLSVADCALLAGDEAVPSTSTLPTAAIARMLRRATTEVHDTIRVVLHRKRHASTDACVTACAGGKKVCLLVHGLGQAASTELLVDSYERTWGDAETKLNCCSEIKFVRLDTINYAWHSDELATQFCNAAMALTPSHDAMALENLAVLSHSMGNLIVASAAMKNQCAVGPTSKWIALAGPMRGSYSANLGVKVCGEDDEEQDEDDNDENNETEAIEETRSFNAALTKTLRAVDVCPAYTATKSLVYKGSALTDDALNALYAEAETAFGKYVTASMCGTSPKGITTRDSAWYVALAKVTRHGSPSDGAVEIDSCRGPFPVSTYSTSWRTGRFYQARLNHADMTMRHGDALWGEDRQPIKWINCQF